MILCFLLALYPQGVYNERSTADNAIQKYTLTEQERIMEDNLLDIPEKQTDDESSRSCCTSCRTKERTPDEYRSLMNRLSRIEGQVRGVKGMLERDAYCVEILIQVSAINSALNSFNKELLGNHIRSCVVENVRSGNDEVIDELVKTIQKLMR